MMMCQTVHSRLLTILQSKILIWLLSFLRELFQFRSPNKFLKKCGVGFVANVEMIDPDKKISDNTAANARTSVKSLVTNKVITSICNLGQHKPRSCFTAAISEMIWKKIKPFPVVENIMITSIKSNPSGLSSISTSTHSPP